MPVDQEYDQTNSLGGPSNMGALGGDYGGGGLAPGLAQGDGSHPIASGTETMGAGVPQIGSAGGTQPAITQPSTPTPGSGAKLPQWVPPKAPSTAAPAGGGALQYSSGGGYSGGGLGLSQYDNQIGGTAVGGGGLTGGGGEGGAGLSGGGGGGGGGHLAAGAPTIAMAEGGDVPDNSDDQGSTGQDPITNAISKAMESVDSAFQYGRQKNGVMGTGQQGGQQNSNQQAGSGDQGAIPDQDADQDNQGQEPDQDEDDANGQ